ncbi:integrase core domain-containing protein [Streptomyces glaucus]
MAEDAGLLVLRHENAVLRRRLADPVRYEPADRFRLVARSSPIPRRRWSRIFPVTPTTPPAWHRGLIAGLGARVEPLRSVLRDRDREYTGSFDAVFGAEGMDVPLSAPQAPRRNVHCARAAGTIRPDVPDHILTVDDAHAHQVLAAYQKHHNTHRPHRPRDQRPPEARERSAASHDRMPGGLLRAPVLSGVASEYRYTARAAAMTPRAPRAGVTLPRRGPGGGRGPPDGAGRRGGGSARRP